jgi:uncharacterized sulfatase
MDEQLGPLFDRIRDDKSLRDNTLIVFCSDNGPEGGAGTAGSFRGSKGTLYEGGIRSPLIVWSPGFVADDRIGSINQQSYFAAFDIAPSLLEIAGVSIPNNVELDGEDMSETLLGKSNQSRDELLFFRRPPDRPGQRGEGNLPDLAVRDGKWKLLCEYDGSRPMLFNLKSDHEERDNVAADHPKVVNRLTAAVLKWHRSMPSDEGDAGVE